MIHARRQNFFRLEDSIQPLRELLDPDSEATIRKASFPLDLILLFCAGPIETTFSFGGWCLCFTNKDGFVHLNWVFFRQNIRKYFLTKLISHFLDS